MTPEQKIDVLKLVYTEEAEALRFEIATAQRLMTYFASLELALGAWVVAVPSQTSARNGSCSGSTPYSASVWASW